MEIKIRLTDLIITEINLDKMHTLTVRCSDEVILMTPLVHATDKIPGLPFLGEIAPLGSGLLGLDSSPRTSRWPSSLFPQPTLHGTVAYGLVGTGSQPPSVWATTRHQCLSKPHQRATGSGRGPAASDVESARSNATSRSPSVGSAKLRGSSASPYPL